MKASEWKALKALHSSLTMREVAYKTGLPLSTVSYMFNKLKEKGKFYFVVNYGELGLMVTTLITDNLKSDTGSLENLPLNVASVRKAYSGHGQFMVMYSIVPGPLVDELVSELKRDNIAVRTVVKGLEYIRWSPGFNAAELKGEFLKPVMEKAWEILNSSKKPPVFNTQSRVPDPIDLAIVSWRIQTGPFTSVLEGIKRIKESDPSFPKVSQQLISYHYRRHVLPSWLYNTYTPFLPMTSVPVRLYLFKGREAPALARALVALPYAYTATIDVDKAIVVAQYPCNMHYNVYSLISTADVELPYGEAILKPSMVSRTPFLWKPLARLRLLRK